MPRADTFTSDAESGGLIEVGPDAIVQSLGENLLLHHPELGHLEIWVEDYVYYLVIDAPEAELGEIESWLAYNAMMGTPPIKFAFEPPEGARCIPQRSMQSVVELRGAFRNTRDVDSDLAISLPRDLPPFNIEPIEHGVQLNFERALSTDQYELVRKAVVDLDIPIRAKIAHRTPLGAPLSFQRRAQGDVALVPSRALPVGTPTAVRRLVEEDEEFWLENRNRVFSGSNPPFTQDLLPGSWKDLDLACVVDASAFPPQNMRSYLTLYDTVVVSLPLESNFGESLAGFGVSDRELLALLETGRLKILLPQPVDRYPVRWLAEAQDSHPDALMGSRRLACAVLADAQVRFPLLYPPLELDDRQAVMMMVKQAANEDGVPEAVRKWFNVLAAELPDLWLSAPLLVHREGALMTPRVGVGWLAAQIFKEFHGTDRLIEIMHAAHGVEWAGALGAHAVPCSTGSYSEEAAADFLATMYSPLEKGSIPIADARSNKTVDNLLGLDNDVPVVDFAREFVGADVQRLRRAVRDITIWNQDDDMLERAIEAYNRDVRQYEKRPDRLKTFNVVGMVPAIAAAAAFPELLGPYGRFLPLGLWMLGVLITSNTEPKHQGPAVGRLIDYVNALLAAETPRAVLLSRLRKQVKALKG